MMELQALPFYNIRKQDHQGKLDRFYSSDSDSVQDECLIDGICGAFFLELLQDLG